MAWITPLLLVRNYPEMDFGVGLSAITFKKPFTCKPTAEV
jgi:hypothetical protein